MKESRLSCRLNGFVSVHEGAFVSFLFSFVAVKKVRLSFLNKPRCCWEFPHPPRPFITHAHDRRGRSTHLPKLWLDSWCTCNNIQRHPHPACSRRQPRCSHSYRLLTLRQPSATVSDYDYEFCILAADSGWNKAALIAAFHNGLSAQLQTELACRDEGMDLNSLISLAISLDQHVRERCCAARWLPSPKVYSRQQHRVTPIRGSNRWSWGLHASHPESESDISDSVSPFTAPATPTHLPAVF